ncbi:hypothetical protein ASJ81_17175 [Methanosarcina spelaei]|uniref:Uncharacterized protein n=1 Tax=Methanosarcina spelaei TaxID=1036679 RepID=A0A2A2HWA9_9EURY|nr:hypothetical protein ASJ81_17175 [Methanosarcina spelaei]
MNLTGPVGTRVATIGTTMTININPIKNFIIFIYSHAKNRKGKEIHSFLFLLPFLLIALLLT